MEALHSSVVGPFLHGAYTIGSLAQERQENYLETDHGILVHSLSDFQVEDCKANVQKL